MFEIQNVHEKKVKVHNCFNRLPRGVFRTQSKLELLAKTISSFQPITIFAKSMTIDVYQGSEYASILLLVFREFTWTYIFSRNSSGAFVTVDQVLQEFLFI